LLPVREGVFEFIDHRRTRIVNRPLSAGNAFAFAEKTSMPNRLEQALPRERGAAEQDELRRPREACSKEAAFAL
jgi:hypothetical protein